MVHVQRLNYDHFHQHVKETSDLNKEDIILNYYDETTKKTKEIHIPVMNWLYIFDFYQQDVDKTNKYWKNLVTSEPTNWKSLTEDVENSIQNNYNSFLKEPLMLDTNLALSRAHNIQEMDKRKYMCKYFINCT